MTVSFMPRSTDLALPDGMPRALAAGGFTGSTELEVVTGHDRLVALEPEWRALVEACGADHPFLTHEWVRTWWECFGEGEDLCVVVVRRNGLVIGIAPLMRRRVRMYGISVVRLASIGNVYTERFDVLAWPGSGAVEALWTALCGELRGWDVVLLTQLPDQSPAGAALARLALAAGHPIGEWRAPDAPYVPLAGTWNDYLGGLDAKHRSNLRNRQRRLARLGKVTLEIVTEEPETALAEGLALEAAAWKGAAGTAIRCLPRVERFYATLASRAAARGQLRLNFLRLDDRRIAFQYCLVVGRKLYLLKPGYAPDYAPYSPSNLLVQLVLEDAFAEGLTEFDLLGAPAPWKADWTGSARSHRWLYVFARRPRGRLAHAVKFGVVPTLRRSNLYPRMMTAGRALGLTRWVGREV